jgi:hypothetical protein
MVQKKRSAVGSEVNSETRLSRLVRVYPLRWSPRIGGELWFSWPQRIVTLAVCLRALCRFGVTTRLGRTASEDSVTESTQGDVWNGMSSTRREDRPLARPTQWVESIIRFGELDRRTCRLTGANGALPPPKLLEDFARCRLAQRDLATPASPDRSEEHVRKEARSKSCV